MELINYKKKQPVIVYFCSYFPTDLIISLGFNVHPFFEESLETREDNGNLPINICSYVRYCQNIIGHLDVDGVVLTNCCNSMQRLYDIIRVIYPNKFCKILELPRSDTPEEYHFYLENVFQLTKELCQHFSIKGFDESYFKQQFQSYTFDEELPPNSIYVLGSAVAPRLKDLLKSCLSDFNVRFNTCSTRRDSLLSANHFSENPCARMDFFIKWFENFIRRNQSNLIGLIYVSTKNCDPFLFNYRIISKICQEYHIKIIGVEEEYQHFGVGQISTRIEAFIENIRFQARKNKRNLKKHEEKKSAHTEDFRKRINLVRAIADYLPLDAIKKVVLNQIDIFYEQAWAQPEKVIWTNMVMPVEILYAADLIPINMELVAGWLASLHLSREYIAECEGLGISPGVCSYHKATLGLIEKGGLPTPKGAVISSHICDGGPAVANYFSGFYGTQNYTINIPFENNDLNFKYLTRQYAELIPWLESYTGKPFNFDKLSHALELSNEAREYWIKALEIRKEEPYFTGYLSLRNLFGATFLFGSPLGVEVAKSYYEQLRELSKNNAHNNENSIKKKRILWIHFAPLYNNKIMEYLENDLNCWIVMDITGHIYWPPHDLNKPFESLARRSILHFYLGDANKRKELYRRIIQDYRIDGIVHFMHNGCRAIPGAYWQIQKLGEEMKIPSIQLVGDCIDPRGFSDGQTRLRLEAFAETLRKG